SERPQGVLARPASSSSQRQVTGFQSDGKPHGMGKHAAASGSSDFPSQPANAHRTATSNTDLMDGNVSRGGRSTPPMNGFMDDMNGSMGGINGFTRGMNRSMDCINGSMRGMNG